MHVARWLQALNSFLLNMPSGPSCFRAHTLSNKKVDAIFSLPNCQHCGSHGKNHKWLYFSLARCDLLTQLCCIVSTVNTKIIHYNTNLSREGVC